ncbi:MAG: iron ABC transporter [Phycisphaerae bacterium]|nr:iron ABC transporter [Phycisphaerae bacterium]MDP6152078.1 metal ABC transporter permease [Phycisphaeraceae bacterium]
MNWLISDTWTIVIGSLCAVACALPGALLVLRRMSMMGDAISHTVLPGLAIAFLLTHSRAPLAMFIGAAVIGVATAFFIQGVQKLGKTESGASMGIVFTTLFAVGLVLMRQAVDHVDIDPDCVLYGAIETAGTTWQYITLLGVTAPRAVFVNGGAMVVNLVLIALLYKEFKISAFDPALATTLGISATLMHYLLMTMTAATAVAAFESVGSILVIAMFIVPPATAYLLTDRLAVMMVLSAVFGVLAAVFGHVAAIIVPPWFGFEGTSTAGMMAVVAGLLFALVWLASPRYGVLARMYHRLVMSMHVLCEDVMGLLYRLEELTDTQPATMPVADMTQALVARAWLVRRALGSLGRQRMIRRGDLGYVLTDAGRDQARQLVRSHRLWESYLAHYLRLPADHLHDPANRLEHAHELADKVDVALGRPETDPQGKTIPSRDNQ